MNAQTYAMKSMADETGGRAFYNTNDLKNALRRSLDDSELTYVLGYYPSHGEWDGKFRPIKVLVKRQGVNVRHRQGYYARTGLPVENTDRLALLKDAAENPLDATGVGVTVRLRPFKSDAGDQVEVIVSVDPRDLTLQPENGRWTGLVDVWSAQYSNKGEALAGISKTVAADLKEGTYQKVMQEGLSVLLKATVEREAQELRVVVRDAPSGAVGSVRIPLRKFRDESRSAD
jgi:hypothetical protein